MAKRASRAGRLKPSASAPIKRREKTLQSGAAARLDQILDTAAEELNAKGVTANLFADIAERLGISRGALYNYVAGREDLVFKVYCRSCDLLAEHLRLAAQPRRPAPEILRDFIERSTGPGTAQLAAIGELGILDQHQANTVLDRYGSVIAGLAAILKRGARAGEIRTCDFDIAARVIVSCIHWIPVGAAWSPAPKTIDRARIVATMNEVLAGGWAKQRHIPVLPPDIDFASVLTPPISAFDRDALFDAKKDRLLGVASTLFNRRGIDATTLEDISAKLGVTKRAIYHYVGDKQTLILDCIARAQRVSDFIRTETERQARGVAEEIVGVNRSAALALLTEDLAQLAPVSGYGSLSPKVRKAAARRSAKLAIPATARWQKAQKTGVARMLDIPSLVLIIPGAMIWLGRGLIDAPGDQRRQIAQEISDLLRIGLKPV